MSSPLRLCWRAVYRAVFGIHAGTRNPTPSARSASASHHVADIRSLFRCLAGGERLEVQPSDDRLCLTMRRRKLAEKKKPASQCGDSGSAFHFFFSFLRGMFHDGEWQRGQFFGALGERVSHLWPHRSHRHSETRTDLIAVIIMMITSRAAMSTA